MSEKFIAQWKKDAQALHARPDIRASEQIANRKHAVASAAYWFSAARDAQREGKMGEALLFMENAYNHTEGALVALRRELGRPLTDDNG